jgi:hypothetical protein
MVLLLLLGVSLPVLGDAAKTVETFRASFEKRMNSELDEHGKSARELRVKYIDALKKLKGELGKAENLKGAAQVVAEIEAIEDGDEAKELPEDADYRFKRVRAQWERSLEKIRTERGKKIEATAKLYLKALDTEKRKLTRAGKIKDALQFEEEEKRVMELPEIKAAMKSPTVNPRVEDAGGDLALASRGAKAEGAQDTKYLIDGKTASYQRGRFAFAKIPCKMEIILDDLYKINRIRFLLWDHDARTYRYRLDVSKDGKEWTTVKKTLSKGDSGWQESEFEAQMVQHIRILGLSNTANTLFHVVEVEAYSPVR